MKTLHRNAFVKALVERGVATPYGVENLADHIIKAGTPPENLTIRSERDLAWAMIREATEAGPERAGRTVRDLIAQLQRCDPDALVSLEGCDCTGEWAGTIDGKRLETERSEDSEILLDRQ